MSQSAPPPGKTPAQAPAEPPTGGEGLWGLDLWNGSAWFSDWFYQRLHWPRQVKRKKLEDLRPHLTAGDWDALLLQIRAHLEEKKITLQTELRVQLPNGEFQWWRLLASAEHNAAGQPVYLSGSMQDVSAERERGAP